MSVQTDLRQITEHMRAISAHYKVSSSASLSQEEKSQFMRQLAAVLQHYLWQNKDKKSTLAKKIYIQCSLWFHPDKYETFIDNAIIKKLDITELATLLGDADNKLDIGAVFKVLSNVYNNYDSTLPSLRDVLKLQKAKPKNTMPTATSRRSTPRQNTQAQNTQARQKSYSESKQQSRPRAQNENSENRSNQQQYSYQSTGKDMDRMIIELKYALENYNIRKAHQLIASLGLSVVLEKLIAEPKVNYLELLLKYCSQNLTRQDAASALMTTIQTHHQAATWALLNRLKFTAEDLQAAFIYALENENAQTARHLLSLGANIYAAYDMAMHNLDNKMLYWIFEICPENIFLNQHLPYVHARDSYREGYNINQLIVNGYISRVNARYLSDSRLKILGNSTVSHLILSQSLHVDDALALSSHDLDLINYPGFTQYVAYCGDFKTALENMKHKRATLSQLEIFNLAYKGIQHRTYSRGGYDYTNFQTIPLQYLLVDDTKTLDNLKNTHVMSLLRSGVLSVRECLSLTHAEIALLEYDWVREAICDAQETVKDYGWKEYYSHVSDAYLLLRRIVGAPKAELDLINAYNRSFFFFRLSSYMRLSRLEREKLQRFMPLLEKFGGLQFESNGFSLKGLNIKHILALTDEQIENMHHPLAEALYYDQGEMGRFLLLHFPQAFFLQNKEIVQIDVLIKNALFYACMNNLPDFIDLYWKDYNNQDTSLFGSILQVQKNCFNLYTLKNTKGQSLEEVCQALEKTKCEEKLQGATYYFDLCYRVANQILSGVLPQQTISKDKKSMLSAS